VKILSLNLIAFGPFTGRMLDLSAGREGLHIVYGLNEAGKSSALRALRQLLHGIPERSTDAFLHPFPKMRIGGSLRSAGGEVLTVVRRKGRGGTLRAADDKAAVEESVLERFLNGIDAALFATMFGIGYEDLVAGGREIVQGGGDLGRLIFAAGSGVADLGVVVEGLQAEADALFRPAGQKQKINEAVGRLKQRRAELREAQLPGQEWARHDQALNAALQAKTGVEAELAQAQRGLSRRQRILEAHPVIAGRRKTLMALETVAAAVLLPDGFSERRTDALTRLRVAQTERRLATANLAALARAASEMGDPSALLGQAEAIEGAHQDLGSQRKAAKDRIVLETRRNTLRAEARQTLRNLQEDLALDDAERLRIRKPESVRIQALGAEYERIVTRIDGTREKILEQERALSAAAARLEALPKPRPVEDLKRRIADAGEALPLEKQLASVRAQAGDLRRACTQSQARLGLSATPLQELGRLAAPSLETVRLFEDRCDGLDRRVTTLADEVRKTEADLSEIDRRLNEARLEREVPTEADLALAREARDRGWRQIRRLLLGEAADEGEVRGFPASASGAASLLDLFEADLRRADETADRLRREADQVAVKARLLADQGALRDRLAKLGEDLSTTQGERDAAKTEWTGVWRPLSVAPRSPREMRQWQADFTALVEKASDALKREAEAAALERTVEDFRASVSFGLQGLSEPVEAAETLNGLVRRARSVFEKEEATARQAEELSRERVRLADELEASRSRLKLLEEDLRHWQRQWEQAVKPLGLGAGTRPVEANAVMEELKSFFDRLREAEVLQQRIEGIDRDAEAFRADVAALADAVAQDLAGRPAEEAAGELQRRLTAGREAQSKRQALQKQSEQEQARLRKADGAVAEIESLLTAMCVEAGCRSVDELPEAERRSSSRRQLEAQLGQEEARLVQLGGGSTLDDFIKEAAAVDPDGIPGDIVRLKEEIARLTAEKSELDQRIGAERTELGRMDGGDRAARIAEDIQALIGGLERDVEHYARLRIAGRVLSLAMERFREKSQGPILRKASELFRRLTCGSFEGLRADCDSDGSPVLMGVRNGGKESVPVGGMSDGTADQLYLALRLAGLENYLEANEPMPFIVDDILIKFDNDRAAAALQALAELSQKTQVIFFTHHRHLLELAVKNLPGSILIEHGLA
jgi:uncharacterized protein YhaN